MVEPYLVVCALLLLGSVLARALPVARHSFDDDHEDGWDLSPRELAYLRCGPYGVVLTVLAELHGEGAVDRSRPGGCAASTHPATSTTGSRSPSTQD